MKFIKTSFMYAYFIIFLEKKAQANGHNIYFSVMSLISQISSQI